MAIAGAVPLACQELLSDTGQVFGWVWLTPHYAANLMIVAVALAGVIVHRNQRSNERAQSSEAGRAAPGTAAAPVA